MAEPVARMVGRRRASRRLVWGLAACSLVAGGMALAFRDGLTKNWADLEVEASDPELRPIPLPLPPEQAVAWAAEVIRSMNRWVVREFDGSSGTLHATRTTRLWQFVDDVRLRFEATADGCRVLGQSRSRVGRGDLGQNARNLKELRRALLERSRS